MLRALAEVVRGAVYLHREPCSGAIEIENIWSDWVLTPDAHFGATEPPPK
jgi:hypothetical protein